MPTSHRRVAAMVGVILLYPHFPSAQVTFTKNPDPGSPILADQTSGYSGVAWIDYDGDGSLDLFVNQSFLYRGDGSGNFSRVATQIGAGIAPATGNGTTWADYDNDGDLDVFIASRASALYRNDGTGAFAQVTSGDIGMTFANRGWSPAWGDYDGDGNLDLAITHPATFVPGASTTNHLFLNGGPPAYDLVRITTGPIVTGLSSYTVGSWSDYDGDGDLDYFVGAGPANGTLQADFLYRNQSVELGSPEFLRIADAPIATDLQDGQLWNWIDFDNDGDLDAYLTNWMGNASGYPNRLYRNDGGGFTSIVSGAIVTDTESSLSSVWGDYDNDGDLDCYVTNDNAQTDRYYSNNADGTFTSLVNALTERVTHRGAAAGDYDDDGDLDLFADGPGPGTRSLFRNDTANGNHYLKIRLIGTVSNRSAIGAKVRVRAQINATSVWQLREVSAQNTFNGHNSLIVHFGLGTAPLGERVIVEWPSGATTTLADVASDQLLEITEDATTPPVPNGASVPGSPVMAVKRGADVLVTWDASTCPAVAINLYHGRLGDFANITSGTCDRAPAGSVVTLIPDDAWFLVAATDGAAADGSYGRDGAGAERALDGASKACAAITRHATNDTCR